MLKVLAKGKRIDCRWQVCYKKKKGEINHPLFEVSMISYHANYTGGWRYRQREYSDFAGWRIHRWVWQACEWTSLSKQKHTIREAVSEKLLRLKSNCVATEWAKLVATFEKKIAKKGLDKDVNQWPQCWDGKSDVQILIRPGSENSLAYAQFWHSVMMSPMKDRVR